MCVSVGSNCRYGFRTMGLDGREVRFLRYRVMATFNAANISRYIPPICIILLMSELRSSLLEKKKLDTFEKYYEDCMHRIKRIKQKNDTLQKNTGTELEDEIAIEVNKQK